ncbi:MULTISPECIES: hypothetical protein [unclassified Carboxylicivirga]|uniref:hypothetical protein n=1 Tax=Carboxylicivirga TaxID=1628153 RepID=UPI003D349F1F
MKYCFLLFLAFFQLMPARAQIKDSFPVYQGYTEYEVEGFEVLMGKDAFSLALNYAYITHCNQNYSAKYLHLPVILVNGKSFDPDKLKDIAIKDIISHRFVQGNDGVAILYGTKGIHFGVLQIETKGKME